MENAGKKTPACRGFGFGHRAYRRICGCHRGRGRTRAFRGRCAGRTRRRAFRGSRAGSAGRRAFRGSRAGSECRRAFRGRCVGSEGCRAFRRSRAGSAGCRAFRGSRAGSAGCRAFRGSRTGSTRCRAFRGSRTGSECRRAFRRSRAGSAGCRAFRGSRAGSEGCRAFWEIRAGSEGCRAFRGSRAGSECRCAVVVGCRAGRSTRARRAFRGSCAGSAGRRVDGLVDGVLEEVFAGGKRFANNRLRALAADFQHVAQVARARGFRAHGGARRPRRVVGNVQRKRGDRRASDRSQQAAAVKTDARPKGRGGGHGERDRQRGSMLSRGQRDFGFRVVAARQLAPVQKRCPFAVQTEQAQIRPPVRREAALGRKGIAPLAAVDPFVFQKVGGALAVR